MITYLESDRTQTTNELDELIACAERLTTNLDKAIENDLRFSGIIRDTLEQYALSTRKLRNELYLVQTYLEG